MSGDDVAVIDVTISGRHERFLYGCLVSRAIVKYRRRSEYLEAAVQKGFRKNILVFKGDVVGTVEYAPPEGSAYSIKGKDIIVINCIWVLRRAKGHRFGARLLEEMMKTEPSAAAFVTLGLEGHWSPWLRRDQLEKLGFKSIDSLRVSHKTKHVSEPFTVHLMWLPRRGDAKPPTWDKRKILEGVSFCMAHPLYHPQTYKPKEILQETVF